MSPDELVLLVQRLIDRLVRRLRLGPAPRQNRRRLLIVGWVMVKSTLLSAIELTRAGLRFVADPVSEGTRGWKWLAFKLGVSLRRIDRSIHQLWRVLRRIPEYGYDLYVLSDHGAYERGGMRVVVAGPNAYFLGSAEPDGNVSYLREVGAHAGPSPEEIGTFIVVPPGVSVPSPITHPRQLYPHFIAYQAQQEPEHAGRRR